MLRLRLWEKRATSFRVLMAFSAALLLIVTAYQLDRLWLRHNLNTYREELKKQGVKFTLKEIWPEPPPAASQAGTQLLTDCPLKPVDLVSFHRVIPNKTRHASFSNTNHHYVRLCLLPDSAFNWQCLKDIISSNKVTLEKIRLDLQNTNLAFAPPTQITNSVYTSAIYHKWSLLCNAIDLFKGSVFFHLHQKEFAQAHSDALNLLHLYKLSTAMPSSTFLQMSLTPTACGLWELLQFDVWTDAQLSEIQTILESIDYDTPTRLFFEIHQIQAGPIIKDAKTVFPFQSFSTFPNTAKQIISFFSPSPDANEFESFINRYPRYWDWCWRKSFKTEQLCLQNDQFWIHVLEESQKNNPIARLYQESLDNCNSQENEYFRKDPLFASFISYPSLASQIERIFTSETIRRLGITAVALRRYHLKSGCYPETLSELAPSYLSSMPIDPMDQKPLRYHKNTDDTFLLYSIALDGTDKQGSLSSFNLSPFKYQYFYGSQDDIPWPQAATPEETQAETIKMKKRQTE